MFQKDYKLATFQSERRLKLVRNRHSRQRYREGTALIRLTSGIHTTTVGVGNCLDEAQSEAGAML